MVKLLILILIGLTATFDLDDERTMMVLQHNFYRSLFNAKGLEQSSDLEKIAQNYADYLLKHPENLSKGPSGNTYKGSKLGENVFVGKKQEEIGELAINAWLDEGDLYYEHPENYQLAPHFTQLVWKSSKLLGCGISCNTDNCYVVCNYYPAGNVINEYDANVLSIDEDFIDNFPFKVNKEELDTDNPLEKFRKEITEKHNNFRKMHNDGELERDSKLEQIAQDHADYMLQTGLIDYTLEKYDGDKIAQNIFYGLGNIDTDRILSNWYSKKKFYDFEKPGFENTSSEQFVNMVWKNTKKIGCGYACNKRECFATCTYYPCGRRDYLYSKNVLPKSS